MPNLEWLTAKPIAHRGYHDMNKTRWENTLSAFEAAAVAGYAIECDVHLSADGVPVVFHDDKLDRLAGIEGNIFEKTAVELGALAIGSTQDRVPTLAQMLGLVAGRVPIVVELKGIEGKDDGLVGKVADELRAYDGQAAIMSFDHWLIRQFDRAASGIPSGLTACGRGNDELEAHFSMLAHKVDFVSYGVDDLPNRFIGLVREKLGLPVITWTVRNEQQRQRTFEHADQMTFEGFAP